MFGGLLGLANLGANYGLGMLDQSIYDLLAQRFSDLPSWGSVLAAPVVEEIVLRLFFMGVVAWVAARFIDDSHKTFLIALWFSAIVFGLLHTFRPLPDSSPFDIIYAVGIAIKSGAATFLLGWIFWKWGLPYAILCHAIANVVHRLAEPMLF
ncbi:MAG: CPBP family intramembrane glutamic endopeptidase [Balneola sp.]